MRVTVRAERSKRLAIRVKTQFGEQRQHDLIGDSRPYTDSVFFFMLQSRCFGRSHQRKTTTGDRMIRKLLASSTIFFASIAAFAQTHQFKGTVTDAMCGKQHMMKNATAAECTRECVKGGSDFALASGDKVYVLKGDKAQLDKYAGAQVIVAGELSGNSITVKSIQPAK